MRRGVQHFVTGRLSSQSYKIKTPTATMGVGGKDVVVQVDEAGATTVSVHAGEVTMASDGGDDASVGASITGSTSGAPVSVAATTGLPAIEILSFGVGQSADGDGKTPSEEEESSNDNF